MTDFVCVGDVTQDNFFFIDEASVHCNINQEDCVLELKYKEKIPVKRFGMTCGKNAANVAVGLARLGISSELVTVFGGDERGAWLKRELLKNNVDLENSRVDEERLSDISSVIIFKGERTILSYTSAGKDIKKKVPESPWIFLSLADGFGPDQIRETKLGFNPSTSDLRKGKDFLAPYLEKTTVLIQNKEEAEYLLGHSDEPKNLLTALAKFGPKIVAVTDGMNGAYVFDGQTYFYCKPFPGEVLETTGAGDGFSTGFLAAIFNEKDLGEAMRWGMAQAASVVGKLGAQEGLLTMEKLQESLNKYDSKSTVLV